MTFQDQGLVPRWPKESSSASSCVMGSPRNWAKGAGSGCVGMAAWFRRQLCFCRMQSANWLKASVSYCTMQRYRHTWRVFRVKRGVGCEEPNLVRLVVNMDQ